MTRAWSLLGSGWHRPNDGPCLSLNASLLDASRHSLKRPARSARRTARWAGTAQARLFSPQPINPNIHKSLSTSLSLSLSLSLSPIHPTAPSSAPPPPQRRRHLDASSAPTPLSCAAKQPAPPLSSRSRAQRMEARRGRSS